MEIISPSFSDGQTIPEPYTCNGKNISPPLEFNDIPEKAKSLILTVDDQDAPNKWVHWLVFNIPVTTVSVKGGQIPEGGVEGLANNKTFGYEGPCPKYFSGTHHYVFTLFALDTKLEIPKESDKQAVLTASAGHIIAQAHLIGTQLGKME